jgi:hypothetical protein
MHDISYLSTMLGHSDRKNLLKMDEMSFSHRFYIVERRVLDLFIESTLPLRAEFLRVKHLYKACCLTLHMYIYLTLREVPRAAALYDTLVNRLSRTLKQAMTVRVRIKFPKLVFWMLCTGGSASFGRPERPWFVEQLAIFAGVHSQQHWNLIDELHGGAMFETQTYKTARTELWHEVEMLRLAQQGMLQHG